MKFAKELEQELVPEWRVKYLDYKTGKKHVKAVSRARSRIANTTPSIRHSGEHRQRQPAASPYTRARQGSTTAAASAANAANAASPAPPRPSQETVPERQSLTYSPRHRPGHYGSIASTGVTRMRSPSAATTFELPAPALRMPSNTGSTAELQQHKHQHQHQQHQQSPRPETSGGDTVRRKSVAFDNGLDDLPEGEMSSSSPAPPRNPRRSMSLTESVFQAITGRRASGDHNDGDNDHQGEHFWGARHLRRIFTAVPPSRGGSHAAGGTAVGDGKDDINMRPFDEVREREQEFFRFLDAELDKVETFYKLKEKQADDRLVLLREQLHVMRERRLEEIQQARRRKVVDARTAEDDGEEDDLDGPDGGKAGRERHGGVADEGPREWTAPLRAKLFKLGPNSKALQKMPQTPRMEARDEGEGHGLRSGVIAADAPHRDYTRRAGEEAIPYRTAKRKLKLALQEFYRGLELLKAYALLNRTAFRKLNKKYDKAVDARVPYRYMNERVNHAYFVSSGKVDELISAAEDLYARYFEGGNHKIAAGKLRALMKRPGDASASSFRTGLMLGLGAVFAIQGVVQGADKLLHDADPVVRLQTGYLLQLYGGYFLMLYLFGLFVVDCRLWARNKINYPFIFEFDPRSHLDWRELAQFPSFFLFLLGLFLWLNFSSAANARLFLYYPVVLIGLTALLLFFPAPTLWHRSRKWFLYSHWRLFFAGFYPVEFRDFFLGDMYCSLTYATSNIELFFCLYAHAWNSPSQCNSSHSRLLGFFSTLPPIWRALQCLRRYHDTRNVFPHLVNCGKYVATIVAAVFLSLYRIDGGHRNLALFIAFSTVNGAYTSFWDLFMDFSLLQADSHHPFLRNILALKTRWPYYTIMSLDPMLRFSWIFYAIFTHDTQHNTICSFCVAFAEVTRRGMWTLLRVENEHCANVAQYKASRDVPLPYHLGDDTEEAVQPTHGAPAFFLGDAVDDNGDDAAAQAAAASSAASPGRPGTSAAAAAAAAVGSPKPSSLASTAVPGRPSTAVSGTGTTGTTGTAGTAGTVVAVAPITAAAAAAAPAAPTADVSAAEEGTAGYATGTAAGTPPLEPGGSVLRRRLTSTLGSAARKSIAVMLAEAHKQDFEKKRRPSVAGAAGATATTTATTTTAMMSGEGSDSVAASPLLSGVAVGLDEGGSSDDDEGAVYEEMEVEAEEEERAHEAERASTERR